MADPAIVGYAEGEPQNANTQITDFSGAAPSSDWKGKRKPTPQELRKWAKESGQSEDFARMGDAVLKSWINDYWDVSGGYFKNKYGDIVEKPDESGPNTPQGRNGYGDVIGVASAQGATPGQGAAPAAPSIVTQGAAGQLGYGSDSLQNALISQFNQGGGIMGGKNMQGVSLAKGGLIWGQNFLDQAKGGPPQQAQPRQRNNADSGIARGAPPSDSGLGSFASNIAGSVGPLAQAVLGGANGSAPGVDFLGPKPPSNPLTQAIVPQVSPQRNNRWWA